MKYPKQLVAFVRYAPVLLFFLFIIWIIVMADNGTKNVFFDFVRSLPYGDKLGHIGLYGTLAALLNIALVFRSVQVKCYYWQWGGLIVLTFALLEELSQYFFPHRTLDIGDVAADVLGISLFSYLSVKLRGRNAHQPLNDSEI